MNKYNVLSFIGEGSFGRVFKVRNKETEGIFALKVIRKKGLSSKELKSLRLECDIQQHLRHPNIIRMVESFDTDSELGVVTEFAERELHGVLGREGCLQEGRAQALTWDLTSALYYLHSHRVLHRDLKPQNVLIDSTGRAKLCDFGLARNMTTGTHVLTSIKGTPLYMAPELIDEKPYDHQADLWSLGCIVYEMMAGQPPFSTSSIVQLVRLIRHHPVQWPSYISPQAISFLQGLLHKNPSMRLSWPEILVHPFVGGHILILPEQTPIESPFTLPLTQSQMAAKQLQKDKLNNVQRLMPQAVKIMERREQLMAVACKPSVPEGALVSDDDSIRAMSAISMRDSLRTDDEELQPITEVNADLLAHQYKLLNQDNLIISNLDTNMAQLTVQPRINLPAINEKPQNDVEVKNEAKVTKQDDHSNVSKKKLCQNLDNFSIRLKNNSVKEEKDQAVIAQSAGDCNKESNAAEKETVLSKSVPPSYKQKIMQFSRDKFGFGSGNRLTRSLKKSLHLSKMQVKPDRSRRMSEPLTVNVLCKDEKEDVKVESDEKADENTPEILENLQLPGDLSSPVHNFIDDDSSPIEKDEWLAFMRSNMNEVMEGDVESLTQQNVVGMMVAVARHAGAGAEVWGSLAALLSLPLVAPHVPRQTISDILRVYLEVKLVPNLVYAARLLVRHGCTENNPLVNRERVLSLSSEETVALCRLLELATQLSLRGAPFVQQLCDAVAVLNIAPLFAHFLSMYDKRLRIVLNTITLLTVILQDLPENAELVESVLLQEDCVNLRVLLTHPSDALKTRSCVLVGLLGRYCCSALDGAWGPQQKEALHVLQRHSNQMLSRAAKCAVRDLSKLPFYRQADVDR